MGQSSFIMGVDTANKSEQYFFLKIYNFYILSIQSISSLARHKNLIYNSYFQFSIKYLLNVYMLENEAQYTFIIDHPKILMQ